MTVRATFWRESLILPVPTSTPIQEICFETDIQTPKSDEIDLVNMGRWPSEVYHRFDYAFWYGNLKENVKKRIDAYYAN